MFVINAAVKQTDSAHSFITPPICGLIQNNSLSGKSGFSKSSEITTQHRYFSTHTHNCSFTTQLHIHTGTHGMLSHTHSPDNEEMTETILTTDFLI